MEKVDVLDNNGSKTGIVKTKAKVHANGDWHKSVHVWILNSKNQLLTQLRHPNKDSYPNMWDISCAGHISAGENSITSAIREVEEEIGILLQPKDFELLFTVTQQYVTNNGIFINNEFNDVYLVQKDLNLDELKIQQDEISEIKFIDYVDLKSKIKSEDKSFVPNPNEYEMLFEHLDSFIGQK